MSGLQSPIQVYVCERERETVQYKRYRMHVNNGAIKMVILFLCGSLQSGGSDNVCSIDYCLCVCTF